MRYMALAADYDDTLATGGRIPDRVVAALERVKATGRRLLLVTGRQMSDLRALAPLRLFDRVVAENGAVLYLPETGEEIPLASPPPASFIAELRARGVAPVSTGAVIVATHRPHEHTIMHAIWEMGLELQIIFNGNAVMVLPPGTNKASGLGVALQQLGLSPHEVVGLGDSENDHSLLGFCECGIAVANAVKPLRAAAAWVTQGEAGDGAIEVAGALADSDLASLPLHMPHREIPLGIDASGAVETLPVYGVNVLVAGPSGAGKSTFATGILERLRQAAYQVCIVDPEGDYGTLKEVVSLGNRARAPGIDEVISSLSNPRVDVAANLLGIPFADRPDYFMQLLPNLLAMRARTGRPHWLLLDEVHHYLPAVWGLSHLTMPQRLGETLLLTVHPDEVARTILEQVHVVIAVGPDPQDTLGRYAATVGERAPQWHGDPPQRGEFVVWRRRMQKPLQKLRTIPGHTERLRHLRKYAEGDLGARSFYFRGPRDRLNLRAQNLVLFCQIGEGVDEDTWLHHLRNGDYARWLREAIKDEPLAARADALAARADVTARESYRVLRTAIEERYILPPLP